MGTRGALVLIGGAEDKKGPCLILRKFIELAGGKRSRIVIFAAAADQPRETGETYREVFKNLGCEKADILDLPDRESGSSVEALRVVEQATAVFFTGGDQLRLTSALGGTALLSTLYEKNGCGLIVAGTSAGASVMSSTMITEGDSADSPNMNTLRMSPGFGFVQELVIDQHFAQRGRISRLLTALGQNPAVLGLGLDEDTAVIIKNDTMQVWGSQTVTVLDGREITHTNASLLAPDQYLALTRVIIHVLPHGYGYNLVKRTPLCAPQESLDLGALFFVNTKYGII